MKKELKHIDISNIKDPTFLKDLSYKELDVLSDDIRNYLLEITSTHGGHLSSNLGVVESTISLCKTFDFTKDKIIFDVGHQCYTYKLLTGRNLKDFREKGGTSGFQKRNESIYDHYEAGHSSTAISAANGFALARDLNKENYNVIAFVGDSSFMNGLSFEGLNNLGQERHKVIIVLNDNEMSISQSVGGLSKVFRKLSVSNFYQKSKHAFQKFMYLTKAGKGLYKIAYAIKNFFKRRLLKMTLFDLLDFSIIGPIDGHDIKALDKAFTKAKNTDKSVVVMLKTIKGKGYSYAENDIEGKWHGVSGFDIATGKINSSNGVSWSKEYSLLLKEEMTKNNKLVTITPGTGYGSGLSEFSKLFKDRFIDVGIAEEHALTLASGLAINGFHPVISIYSTFLQRGYDQISHDLARMNLNSTLLIDRSGLVGKDGETHQGLYDESFLLSIPNVTIAMADNESHAKELLEESFNNHGVFAIRYPREDVIDFTSDTKVSYGNWIKELSAKEIAIVSVGPITHLLKEELIKNNIKVSLYNAIYIRPINEKIIEELLAYKKIIIYDAYATNKGFSSYLSSLLLNKGYKGIIISKTVANEFVKQASIEEQRKQYNISIEDIINLVK